MPVKKTAMVICILIILILAACFSSSEKGIKDFNENMLDLRIYHENLGDAIISKQKENAAWFINDMDSILQMMAGQFKTYRKLDKPFNVHYTNKLSPYLKDLKKEINRNEWNAALDTYSILTRKCNGCHIDHHVEKEVIDVTKR